MQTISNAVIYARFSSERQNEQSIEGQLRYCYEYAERMGYNVIGEYIDRAMSGTNDNRPEFQRLIADSAKKQFEFVIVWKLDRFSRNRYDSAIYKSRLKRNGVKVISATEGIGEGDESIILEAVLEAMAETYSRQLSQNVRRGMKESALKCNSLGGYPPIGYMVRDKKYVVNEKEAPAVRLIFKRYAQGVPKKEIADELNAKGYRTRAGKEFKINSFQGILGNKIYTGCYHYNGVEIEGGCEALIDKELFNKCQDVAKLKKRAPARTKAKNEYILGGKLFCGHCGSQMVGDSGRSRSGKMYYYYACNDRKKKGSASKCDKKREHKDYIEWYVVEQTVDYVLTPKRIDYIAGRVVDEYYKEFSASGIKELEKRLVQLDNELSKCAEAMIQSSSEIMARKIDERAKILEQQQRDTEIELAKLRVASKAVIEKDDIVKWLQQFCGGDLFDMEYRKKIIDVFVNAIYLFDDKVVIYYNVKGGKQVSYIEMKDNLNDVLEENCSDFKGDGPPNKEDRYTACLPYFFNGKR